MKALRKLRDRKRDMSTLSNVLTESLAIAQRNNAEHAGAEHLMLAALNMNDGTARRAFERVDANPDDFAAAIDTQLGSAVPSLEMPETTADANDKAAMKLKPDATYDAAVKATHGFHNSAEANGPLSGAHFVAGIATIEHGSAARALKEMGIDPADLVEAAIT